uniref:Uncharacterized protein n=2 Tax=Candidatus Kentrum sp. DK TaxID=2126562 RepID=A0A450RX88_9GAMM|nr:MAG: hypothetical protein BECKDK2373B_GA0170837_100659 [Candidatus Kentron sp. DK]
MRTQPGKSGTKKVDERVHFLSFSNLLIVLSRIFRKSDYKLRFLVSFRLVISSFPRFAWECVARPRPQPNRCADVCCGSLFDCNYLPYEPVIGLSGRARLLPSRKYREIKLGGSLALPDKW